MDRVLGLLSGGDVDDSLIADWCSSAEKIYAADSSGRKVIQKGHRPIIVGDMDSFVRLPDDPDLDIRALPSQDATDCDKLLQEVAKDGYKGITLSGVEGDRPDHVLSTYASAVRSEMEVRFAFRRGLGWVIKPGAEKQFYLLRGHRFSLLSLEPCEGVHLAGCAWPISGGALSPTGLQSISNQSTQEVLTVQIGTGAALLFIEYLREEMPFW